MAASYCFFWLRVQGQLDRVTFVLGHVGFHVQAVITLLRGAETGEVREREGGREGRSERYVKNNDKGAQEGEMEMERLGAPRALWVVASDATKL
eukprot:CAMPEP_0174380014 /NCGR_PEP_ID=MMETSP0811_2-20130205/123089_1 /TAXON_ID=73025 ORGANISM="Eutreptiella gymnastica-like, Strain CCMP1594" /NCGR_SAMPLE_ID=MMETSP0811_2 /ASSEMBLY_ACC=CAM_ASM_000667 /LENGTH=93 /DNA_ID=CAMNT_0015532737 /DNA_START=4078 /DNA_END=4360 /DNA_ORIENTATION=-